MSIDNAPRQVLIIEDDVQIRDLIAKVVTSMDWKVALRAAYKLRLQRNLMR